MTKDILHQLQNDEEFTKNSKENSSFINKQDNNSEKKSKKRELLKKFFPNRQSFVIFSICFTIFLYFTLYTIFGHRGVIDYFRLNKQLQEQNLIKDQLSVTISDKKNLVDGMRNESLDIDLLDEQVRKNLGYAKKNEIIIYPDKIKDQKTNQ